jgi:hypothetical protein
MGEAVRARDVGWLGEPISNEIGDGTGAGTFRYEGSWCKSSSIRFLMRLRAGSPLDRRGPVEAQGGLVQFERLVDAEFL